MDKKIVVSAAALAMLVSSAPAGALVREAIQSADMQALSGSYFNARRR
jgi:hypothetical protein